MCFGAVSAQHPTRQLLGGPLGYVPQGCSGLILSVNAEESDASWFQQAPEIRGTVTLSNPNTYDVPVSNVVVQARSSEGLLYSATANCNGATSTVVPANPQPYQYGTTTCRFRLVLDRRVFGSYGSTAVGASGSPDSSGRRLLGGYGYFPSPDQRPSWTVTAVATIQYSNAQCLSPPVPVNTDSWWSWLSGWASKHFHPWGRSGSSGSGRKLLKAGLPVEKSADQVDARRQLSSVLDNCNGLINPVGFVQANVDGSYGVVGRVTLQNPGPVPLPLSSIKVTLANTIGFRPLFVTADCHGATAVAAFSSITCNYLLIFPQRVSQPAQLSGRKWLQPPLWAAMWPAQVLL